MPKYEGPSRNHRRKHRKKKRRDFDRRSVAREKIFGLFENPPRRFREETKEMSGNGEEKEKSTNKKEKNRERGGEFFRNPR